MGSAMSMVSIEDVLAEVDTPPVGAVVGVSSWPEDAAALIVTPDLLDESGERCLRGVLGPEAVEIARRHRGQRVVFLPERDLQRVPARSDDGAGRFFGATVYHLFHRG